MRGASPAGPGGSRRKEAGCHGGIRAWASAREVARKSLFGCRRLLNRGGQEVPPSRAFAVSWLRWAGGVPTPATRGQTSRLGAAPGAPAGLDHPNVFPWAGAPFWCRPQPRPRAQLRPFCPGSQIPPWGWGCLGSFRLLLKSIFRLA